MASTVNRKTPIHILSLNVRGLGKGAKRSSLFHWLKKHHDVQGKIIFLQETHVTKAQEYKWNELWHGKKIFANGTSRSKGVAILLPKSLDFKILSQTLDPDGRYIALKIEIEGTIYGLINCYAPTADKLEEQMVWLDAITGLLETLGDTNIIVGGDINDGLTKLDKFKGMEEWKESWYVLGWKEACQEYQMVDIWRILNPLAHKYTWKQGTNKKNLRRSRLDFWLISSGLMYSVDNTSILPGYGSDHCLITLSLYKQVNIKQGPSFWKFNTTLLRDKVYIDKTRASIEEFKVKYRNIGDKGLKWDVIKMELRSGAISYSKFLAKNKRNKMKELMEKQIKLDNEIASNPSDDNITQSGLVKEEIEQINAEKARGAMMRSKADWVEFGEKNTSYFLRLENRNKQVKNITMLIDENDKEINDQKDILQEELQFYRNLTRNPKTQITPMIEKK
jgi:exonuclease III